MTAWLGRPARTSRWTASFVGAVALASAVAPNLAKAQPDDTAFVQRSGSALTLNGHPYRYSGMNIEWLGVEFYGASGEHPPAVPTRFEVQDALATASEMGSRVVRAQTLGDSVGCADCLEPQLGVFNEAALNHLDEVIEEARRQHIRLIIPMTGDCTVCVIKGFPLKSGINQYLAWFGATNQDDFFKDPRIIAAFEKHISALLEHRNHLTGVRLKDDPTILAWENCNVCTLNVIMKAAVGQPVTGQEPALVRGWVEEIGRYLKANDRNHLYFDNSGLFRFDPSAARMRTPDIMGMEYYPHWALVMKSPSSAQSMLDDAKLVTAAGKVYAPSEIGWDRTNWTTQKDFQALLDALAADPNISGDAWWALQAHAPDHGWQAIPIDEDKTPFTLEHGESGEWWALYYTGRTTLVSTKADMAERAQQLRAHAYVMAGDPTPPHALTPAPEITSDAGKLYWRGAAGAATYSIERAPNASGPWTTVCDRCVTDESDGWADPSAPKGGAVYRITGYNVDGVRGASSPPGR